MSHAADSVWKLRDSVGELRSHALAGQIDLARPDSGLLQARWGNRPFAGPLLCVRRDVAGDWPAVLADRYVRGNDLVATYAAGDDWPYAPQIYWRAAALDAVEESLASLALLVSVETHLLDTHPHVNIETQLEADSLLIVDGETSDGGPIPAGRQTTVAPTAQPGCLVWRLTRSAVSYAEIMPASDFRQLSIEHQEDGTCRAVWRVFADFLEKGVIRRAQLHAVLLPRENDAQLAAACCRAIVRSPLPLTT